MSFVSCHSHFGRYQQAGSRHHSVCRNLQSVQVIWPSIFEWNPLKKFPALIRIIGSPWSRIYLRLLAIGVLGLPKRYFYLGIISSRPTYLIMRRPYTWPSTRSFSQMVRNKNFIDICNYRPRGGGNDFFKFYSRLKIISEISFGAGVHLLRQLFQKNSNFDFSVN